MTGPIIIYIFLLPLSPLSSWGLSFLCLLFARLVCPYPQVRHGRHDWLPPERGGIEGTLRPVRGDGGVTSGAGPRARSEAAGVNNNERHLHHSSVSSLAKGLWKDKVRRDNSGFFVVFCVRQLSREGLFFCVCLFYY